MPTQLNPNRHDYICPSLQELQEQLDIGQIDEEEYQRLRQYCGYNGSDAY